MPTVTPTPTPQPPAVSIKTQAQPTRPGRTNGAIGQDSPSFDSALSDAGQSIEKKAADKVIDPATGSGQPDGSIEPDAPDAPDTPDAANGPDESDDTQADAADKPDPAAPAPDDTTETDPEPNAETQLVEARAIIAPAIPVPGEQLKAPSITPAAEPKEPAAAPPGAPGAQPANAIDPSTDPGAAASEPTEAGSGGNELDGKAPEDPAVLGALAPAPPPTPSPAPKPKADPKTQPGALPDAGATDGPIEGAALAPQAPVDSNAGFGESTNQQQPDQRIPGAPTPAPEPESADAQPMRPVRVDPAPGVIEPAPINAPPALSTPNAHNVQSPLAPQGQHAPSLGSVDADPAFTGAVQRGLAAAVRQQGGTLTIKLDPPTLGKLTIRMTIDQGRVEASFDAQTAQARDLLIEHASTLRTQLRERGLTVERLEVVGASGAGRPGHSTTNTGDQPGTPGERGDSQHDAAGGQSRGRSETGEDEPSTGDGARGDSARSAGEPSTSPFETRLRYSVSAVA